MEASGHDLAGMGSRGTGRREAQGAMRVRRRRRHTGRRSTAAAPHAARSPIPPVSAVSSGAPKYFVSFAPCSFWSKIFCNRCAREGSGFG
jgi:hypothetical protein